ncbi:MAG: N-acetylneuraminate synthase family protein [Deltaproteobacteria bacterium]|jgi:N-acetylneuraminate synthase|nr:N-acetylneuraminate synthase family protein [Deltaproteobacteria bacterium]
MPHTAHKPLFIFEMANNHQGSVEHGKRIIRAMKEAAAPCTERFRFAVKFQYRDLDSFIHPSVKASESKHVRRFLETRLSQAEFAELLACVRENAFLAVCTPFDEVSARRVQEEGYDYLKIASASFGDWPLMEAAAEARLPVIASTAGSDMDMVRNVVSFFSHRRIPLSLMHCVGEYPTPDERLQMNQIDLFRREFPELAIGFSTHEAPDNMEPVKIAVAKGARLFEKHVGVPTDTPLNGYSANPEQVRAWLAAADAAFTLCGVENARYVPGEKEAADLAALRRGIFVKADGLDAETELNAENMYFAFPCRPGQLLAQDFSKYSRIVLKTAHAKDEAVTHAGASLDESRRQLVVGYVAKIVGLLKSCNAVVPVDSTCDLSHHYGLENYDKTGLALIDCVNREYCKKLLVLLPGQAHPTHHHAEKEETFMILHGDLKVTCRDRKRTLRRGETMTVERGAPHSFSSEKGCVFEEISTTHLSNDSYYEKQDEFVSPRKTTVFLTKDVLE